MKKYYFIWCSLILLLKLIHNAMHHVLRQKIYKDDDTMLVKCDALKFQSPKFASIGSVTVST